jgi:nucleoside 2-deoxyribosyltransferase
MSFKAETYQVLIASPSDLGEERDVATAAIGDWNAVHALAEGVVLLPVRWETHALPSTGGRPQGFINEQLVQDADILLAMFWTKLGTNTGVAESGTVEEIDQFVAAGKPASLYFSDRPIAPSKIDQAQMAALKNFKTDTYRDALVGKFTSPEELRTLLNTHLVRHVRRLKKNKQQPEDTIRDVETIVRLVAFMKEHGVSLDEATATSESLGFGPFRRTPSPFRETAGIGEGKGEGLPAHTSLTEFEPIAMQVPLHGGRLAQLPSGDKVEIAIDEETGKERIYLRLRSEGRIMVELSSLMKATLWAIYKRLEGVVDSGAKMSDEAREVVEKMRSTHGDYVPPPEVAELAVNPVKFSICAAKMITLQWVLGEEWAALEEDGSPLTLIETHTRET